MANPLPERPLEEPLSELERQFINAYLAGAGADYHALLARTDDEARTLLRRAAQFASERLGEIEARSGYIHKLHGES
jgi:hypothetical protein